MTRATEDNIKRAQDIYQGLEVLITQNGVRVICTETMSWPRNAGVVAKMGIAWGVIAAIAYRNMIPIVQASPMEIKRKVAGDGKASKERMIAEIVSRYPDLKLPEQETLQEHAADAVGAIIASMDTQVMLWARQ